MNVYKKIIEQKKIEKEFALEVEMCLSHKISDLEDREPDEDGYKHDQWEERLDSLTEIYDFLQDLIDVPEEEQQELLEELKSSVIYYQLTWGGLKR